MALENTLNNIGDTLLFKSKIMNGVNTINGFSDSVTGETGTRFFIKEFRVTTDMINWSDAWIALTGPNLQAVTLDYRWDWQIEYRYTRGGTDPTGSIAFEWVSLQNLMAAQATCGQAFDDSIFTYFFESCNDQAVLVWCANVLEKMYTPGVVSKSLIRGDNRNATGEDRDYIDFWRTSTCFFGQQVAYARQFENFDMDERLFRRYLKNKGMFVDKNQTRLSMVYLMTNLINEITERGTPLIATTDIVNVEGSDEDIHGELLRIIDFEKICDEIIFLINNPKTIGWTMNVNSPLNKYIHDNPWAVKLFNSSHVLADVPLINSGNVTLLDYDGFTDVFKIDNVLPGANAGIGITNFDTQIDYTTKIDVSLPYEMTFWAKGDAVFSATIRGFDIDGVASNPVALGPLQSGNGVIAIDKCRLAQDTEWYFVRVILFPYNEAIVDDPAITTTNITYGWNQRSIKNMCRVGLEILVQRGSTGTPIVVKDKEIIVKNGELYTMKRSDLLSGWMRLDRRQNIEISVTAFTGPGDLLLEGNVIGGFPQTVTTAQLFNGDFQFQDDGTDPLAKTILITYSVLEVTSTGTDTDFLYIRDINSSHYELLMGKE